MGLITGLNADDFLDEEALDTLGNKIVPLRKLAPATGEAEDVDLEEALAESSASSSDTSTNTDIESRWHADEPAHYRAKKLVTGKKSNVVHIITDNDDGIDKRVKTGCGASPFRTSCHFGSANDMASFVILTRKKMCDQCLKPWPVDMVKQLSSP